MNVPKLLLPVDAPTPTAVHQPVTMADLQDVAAAVTDRSRLTADRPHDLKYAPAVTATEEGQTGGGVWSDG